MSTLKKLYFLVFGFFLLMSVRADDFEDEDAEDDVGPVIGIDLGTTYSVVGVYQNGKVDIIANEQGNRITPSYVAYTADEMLVGESAKNQVTDNPKNTIFAVKRLMGRRFDEKHVQDDIKHLPYKVVSKDSLPRVQVTYKNKKETFSPEEVSAAILSRMKKMAENYLGTEVTHAVITVPAYFNDAQRKATKNAGTIAGLNVLRIINEPTSAAIAYGIDKKSEGESLVLVYDLGGGTFDVSVLAVDGGVFEVKATNGNTHLGGEDFDLKLALHLADEFKKQTGINIRKKIQPFSRLKKESERVKRLLSSQLSVEVELESLHDGKDFKTTVTRSLFEKLCMSLFRATLNPVRTVLADAKLLKKDIDEIVLVGGSTRIPMVEKLVGDFFNGKKLHKDINPDEAVSYGACVQGFILSGKSDEETEDMLLLDVTPLSLGIETVGGVRTKIINKNTAIPTSKTQSFTTNEDDQPSVTISVYEGEARMVSFNHLLGRFDLNNIDKAPRGVPQIEVTFEIDTNGILLVTAKDKASGKNSNLRVDEAMSGSSSEEVEKMRENFEKHAEEDERLYNHTVAKNKLDSAIHSAKTFKKKNEKKLGVEDMDDLSNLIEEASSWMAGADASSTEVADFEAKTKEVEDMVKELEAGDDADGDDDEEDEDEEGEDDNEEGDEGSEKKEL